MTRIRQALDALESAYCEHGRSIRQADTTLGASNLLGAEALHRILEGSERWKAWQKSERDNPSF
jgi:hypothetical protein